MFAGFTIHHGFITTSSDQGAPVQRKIVRPALPSGYEDYFYHTILGSFFLPIKGDDRLKDTLQHTRYLEPAIGVIYLLETERQSRYIYANLVGQFDAIIHIEETQALKSAEIASH